MKKIEKSKEEYKLDFSKLIKMIRMPKLIKTISVKYQMCAAASTHARGMLTQTHDGMVQRTRAPHIGEGLTLWLA